MEAVCYFLAAPDGRASPHRAELEACVEETVTRIEQAIQPDGYLGIYFTVVDPAGRFMNLRDMHELCMHFPLVLAMAAVESLGYGWWGVDEVGHLTEAALAHYHLTHSRRFLDVMIRVSPPLLAVFRADQECAQTIDLLMLTFGPGPDQLHGYGGHPELELAMLRLYGTTKDARHLQFGRYLLEERGTKRQDQGGQSYFVWEAKDRRKDLGHGHQMEAWDDVTWALPHYFGCQVWGRRNHMAFYCQAHLPLHDQKEIIGHSVRAL